MQKLSKKNGFSLIEVVCSIAMITLLFFFILDLELMNINARNRIAAENSNFNLLEAVQKELLFNCSYNDVISLNRDKKIYINDGVLNMDNLKNSDIKLLFSSEVSSSNHYVVMMVTEEKVLKIDLQIHYWELDKEKILQCEFYKGNY